MAEVLLFAVGFAIGWIWFGHVGLAVFYGTPRAIIEVIRGTVRVSAAFAYVFMIVLWTSIFIAVAFGLDALGVAAQIRDSQSALLGELVGLGYGVAAAFSQSGRTALNDDFWHLMARYRRTSVDTPTAGRQRLEAQDDRADRIDEYFRDALYVFMHPDRPPAARMAALAAGKIAPPTLRASLIHYLRTSAAAGRPADPLGARTLEALADELDERNWDVPDVLIAKRALRDANREYASALDIFDSDVFRRLHPRLFTDHGDAEDSDSDDEVIEAYARVMESQKGPFKSEAVLPYPKSRIRTVLERAAKDPVYGLGGPAVAVAQMHLDTFLPDHRLASARTLLEQTSALSRSGDEAACVRLLTAAPELERNALLAVLGVIEIGGRDEQWHTARRAVAALTRGRDRL